MISMVRQNPGEFTFLISLSMTVSAADFAETNPVFGNAIGKSRWITSFSARPLLCTAANALETSKKATTIGTDSILCSVAANVEPPSRQSSTRRYDVTELLHQIP
jgi:hypothetical protein